LSVDRCKAAIEQANQGPSNVIGNPMLHPEKLMLTYGDDPQLSEGAVKPPVRA
jgi:hypothetical protein